MSLTFASYVDDEPGAALNLLPLTHVVSSEELEGILEKRCIHALLDKRLGQPVNRAYAFYGRPAYEPDLVDGENHSFSHLHPVCFLLKPNLIGKAAGMFPFDTGAFMATRYDNSLPGLTGKSGDGRVERIRKFEMTNSRDTPWRFVHSFFHNNEKYYSLIPRQPLARTGCTHVNAYHGMLANSRSSDFDHRCGTMEILFEADIELTPDNVLMIVVSDELREKNRLVDHNLKRLEGEGIAVGYYRPTHHSSSHRLGGELGTRIEQILVEQKILTPPGARFLSTGGQP